MRERLGCFSNTAIISASATLLVVVGLIFGRGYSMFSPGELNSQPGAMLGGVASHAETGGRCEACHTAPWNPEKMEDRCGDCHEAIVGSMSKIAKAHGQMENDNPNLACAHCHPEHNGADGPLTVIRAGDEFPHEALGFPLTGHQFTLKGEAFECADCHEEHYPLYDQADCETCHLEIDPAFMRAHVLGWGEDCLACHDGVDTYTRHFDHGEVPFALTGLHVEVTCYSCHLDARSLVDLKDAPRQCNDCHQNEDPHEERFGTDCAYCHSTDGWKPALYDHAQSDFKLTGKHAEATCNDCHQPGSFGKMSSECVDCHSAEEPHEGKFGTDCVACHSSDSWKPAFDHNKTVMPLIGGHRDVLCESCHENRQYKDTSAKCLDCHGYPGWHGSAFGSNCLQCHRVDGWSPAEYGLGHPWFNRGHGGGERRGGGTCMTCHPGSIYNSDCGTCHDSLEGDWGGRDD